MFDPWVTLMTANELGNKVADAGTILSTIVIGLGTVFVGLICIIVMCKIMSLIVNGVSKSPAPAADTAAPDAAPAEASSVIENRGPLAAAIAAAVAEDLGTDVSGIRILSIKKK